MRRVLLTTISLLAFTVTGALAADLPRGMPAKAPAYVPVGYNWTGFYVGINGGYGWSESRWRGVGTNNPDGGMVGGTAGYNWQALGSPWVFGLEGDIDWSGMKDTFTNAACPAGCQTKNNWLGTARGRIGYAVDRVLPYVTGGLAVGDIEGNQPGFAGTHDTNAGWTVGGGVEAAITGKWTAKVEYLHVDLGSAGCNSGCVPATRVGFHSDMVRAGVNLRF